ncbi:MAG: DUF3604 domain-containing protein [Treponema sp.]|nr:DUF3604 domain-containing protein [Treponema sp.]
MKLLWGDLHNHCGITYGSGSLEHALRLAQAQLDFCSVTPHGFWPDMPARNEDTAFIIDFHENGFEKIKNNWSFYTTAMEKANVPGKFSTFFSFEMHSSMWGDYTFVSPDRNLRITPENIPGNVIKANETVPMIGIPHHIGYTPGYRGINWEGFNGRISPVVEVCSKHGCAMHDYSGFPYYHDMGPLDSRNTVFRGLALGKQFSFVGSTDHHAGCPGSFGDGKTAILAEENTRDALWEALLKGRVYAVTGNKIKCDFSVNGYGFGSRIKQNNTAEITYSVQAGGALDRVIIYRNIEPLHLVDGLTLDPGGGPYKVKLEFGWGGNIEPFRWNIRLNVKEGFIMDVEPCFRGANMISPTQKLKNTGSVNDLTFNINEIDKQNVSIVCDTLRNISTLHPNTSALIFEIDGGEKTRLYFDINDKKESIDLSSLLRYGFSGHLKPYSSNAYRVHTAVPHGRYSCNGSVTLPGNGNCYHMEVIQRDGDRAFVSPVYMNN